MPPTEKQKTQTMLSTDFRFGEVYDLSSQINAAKDKATFRNIFDNANGGVSLLALEAGQNLAEHLAPAEVMVYVLEGEIEFTLMDQRHKLRTGEFLLMGEGVPHSVTAKDDSKIMLIKIKS